MLLIFHNCFLQLLFLYHFFNIFLGFSLVMYNYNIQTISYKKSQDKKILPKMSNFSCFQGQVYFQEYLPISFKENYPMIQNFEDELKKVQQLKPTGKEQFQIQKQGFSLQNDGNEQQSSQSRLEFLFEHNPQLEQPQKKRDQKQKDRIESEDSNQFNNILREKKIKPKKNNNVAKHYIKKLIFLYKQQGHKFFSNTGLQGEMGAFINKEKKIYKEQKNWNNNLQSINKVLGINQKSREPQLRSFLSRKMANHMIRQFIIPEILKNGQINTIYQYLLTLKVIMLRNRNVNLIGRTTSH